jgi:hypothetical protein
LFHLHPHSRRGHTPSLFEKRSGAALTATVTGLTNGTSYTFKVVAKNSGAVIAAERRRTPQRRDTPAMDASRWGRAAFMAMFLAELMREPYFAMASGFAVSPAWISALVGLWVNRSKKGFAAGHGGLDGRRCVAHNIVPYHQSEVSAWSGSRRRISLRRS